MHNVVLSSLSSQACSLFKSYYSLVYRFTKLKCSDPLSESDVLLSLALDLFLNFIDLSTVELIRMLISLQSDDIFLALGNLPRPPPPQAYDQVTLIYLGCTYMKFHSFMSCPWPFRVQEGLFLLSIFVFSILL